VPIAGEMIATTRDTITIGDEMIAVGE